MPKGFHNPRYRALIEQLVAARQEKGWRQADLAARLGHHQQFISRVETGERRIDFIEFADIARVLDLDLAELASSIPPRP